MARRPAQRRSCSLATAQTNFQTSPSFIMAISGHKTASMVRRYDKVDSVDRKAAMERIGHFLDTSVIEMPKTA